MANPEQLKRHADIKDLSPIYNNGDPGLSKKGQVFAEWAGEDFFPDDIETYFFPLTATGIVEGKLNGSPEEEPSS